MTVSAIGTTSSTGRLAASARVRDGENDRTPAAPRMPPRNQRISRSRLP